MDMNLLLLIFIGGLCMYEGGKILSSEERNKVFNRYAIQVEDVKKYNKFCASLVIAFGIVAEITMFIAYVTSGLIPVVCTLLLIAEACIVMKIYNKGEKKMLKKR